MFKPFNKSLMHAGLAFSLSAFLSAGVQAQETAATPISEILNYREYSPTFASAGQPTREQLEVIRDSGFERVIYI